MADSTVPPITVSDYCGNTSDQLIMITVQGMPTAQQVPNDTVTLHYGACDTLLHITPPAYIPPVAAWQNSLVFANDVNPDSNEGALLGRVAPGTYPITWTVTDPCGGAVSFVKKYVVQYPPCGEGHTVTDADGNAYETVRIGCECWTKSNLKTTKYSDGTAVPFANGYASLDCPDTDANIAAFGRLYTWHSAVRAPEGDNNAAPASIADPVSGRVYVQGVCPEGWALPSAADLQDVTDRSADAKGLKSADQSKWLPGAAGTDALGFGAVAGGYHNPVAARYMNLLGEAFFWSHDTHTATEASCLAVAYYCEQALYQDKAKGTGYSVRCVKRANAAANDNGDVAATGLPTVTTGAVSAVFATAATCAGTVTAEGSSAVTERGVCYGVCSSPAVDNSVKVAATGTAGTYSCKLTGLSPTTTYYVCAYATNGQGTAYGTVTTFTTKDFPKVTTNAATSVTASTATCGGNVTSDGGAAVTERGVCYGTEANPTVAGSKVTAGSGTGVFTCSLTGLADGTAYHVRAYATNGVDTAYGNAVTFTTLSLACTGTPTVTDVDGNTYKTVQIGDQCWMRENLRTTKYSDGTAIALGSSRSYSTAYRYCPNDDAANVPTYGYLYNWKAVMRNSSSSSANPSGVQGVCPAGWHVPSDAEWKQLTDYVSSQSQYQCGGSRSNIAKALASTAGWSSDPESCAVGNDRSGNNATGFSALPAGNYLGSYYSFGYNAGFWSSTEIGNNAAYYRCLYYYAAGVGSIDIGKSYGYSVRCLRNELPTVSTGAVTATFTAATVSATVEHQGTGAVTERGVCYGTEANPTVANSKVTATGTTGSYSCSLTGLAEGTAYYVRAYATNSKGTAYGNAVTFTTLSCPATVTDVDNNTYNTVQIGDQCWMRENLRTTKYSDGTAIPQGAYLSTDTAYRYCPNNDANIVSTYGYLYNWTAVMRNSSSSSANPSGVQGVCPAGWHVPSNAEWTQLTDYVSSQSQYQCGGTSTNIAKALASATGWSSSSATCAVGNNPSGNNATGFSALPAGRYLGVYPNVGNNANFWSSTEGSNDAAYTRTLYSSIEYVYSANNNKYYGYSVRCLKD
jgi:uncharacterized protein (TIGR02145 family)